jgi:hypothetical protein
MAPARILAHVGPVVSLILASLPYLAVAAVSLPGHSLMAAQSATDQRRALELLAGSAKQGCTEAFLLAHGSCWPTWSGLASQPRRSSARILAAKPECISLTLAGGRSGLSGRNDILPDAEESPGVCRASEEIADEAPREGIT